MSLATEQVLLRLGMSKRPLEVHLHPIEVVVVEFKQRSQLVHVIGVGGNGAVAGGTSKIDTVAFNRQRTLRLLAIGSARCRRAESAQHLHLHLRRWHRSVDVWEQ